MTATCTCGHPEPASPIGHRLDCAVWDRQMNRAPAPDQPAPTPAMSRVTDHTYTGSGGPCTTTRWGQTCGNPQNDHDLRDEPSGACVWPDCLTDGQQAELAAQARTAWGGEPTTPMPDQRNMCGCTALDGPSPFLPRIRQAWAATDDSGERFTDLGMDPERLRRIIDGTQRPNTLDMALIAEACRVTVDWLLGGKEPRQPLPPRPAPSSGTTGNPFQVWPLARILREITVGSGDWTWDEEWADLDARHPDELAALEADITANGITTPVLIGNDGRLWDGHHRLRIAAKHGIGYVPVEITPAAGSDDGPHARYAAVIADALRRGAYRCDGDCGKTERDCTAEHPVQVAHWTHGEVSDIEGPIDAIAALLAPAVAAVRDHRMEQLTAERNMLGRDADRLRRDWTTMRTRAEQAEDLLRVAHDTSNRSEAERARAVQRAETAEAAIKRVRDLHRPEGVVAAAEHGERPDCATCGYNTYPCPTLRALDGPAGTTPEQP
jgi:ParB-like chromosome segregation protein Spo0J